MYAICLASDDHSKAPTPFSAFVSWTASPPSGLMANSCGLSPARALLNVSHAESGDHVCPVDDLSPRVSWNVRLEETSATQICVTKASCFQSVDDTEYATHLPSGDTWAFPSVLRLSRSSTVGTFAAVSGAGAANGKAVAATKTIDSRSL